MPRVVVLLRGINVGRGKRVPMAEFRALLGELGFGDARTLLNSGNAVCEAPAGTARTHASRIHDALIARLAVDVPVIVKSAAELAAIVRANPFTTQLADPSRLLVVFAPDAKALASVASVTALATQRESLVIGTHAAYFWCPDGILSSKAGEALLGKPGRLVTTRNWATVMKIEALLKSAA